MKLKFSGTQVDMLLDVIKQDLGNENDWDSVVDQLRDKVDNPCPYTHSHTSQWCGYPLCRRS